MNTSILIYLVSLVTLSILYSLSRGAAKNKSDKIVDALYRGGKQSLLLKKQLFGIAALSVPVVLYFSFHNAALKLFTLERFEPWIYFWIMVLTACIYLSSKATGKELKKLKENNIITNRVQIAAYFTGRVIFLFLYELFFRAVLLFSLAAVAGNLFSILVNVGCYVALHAHCKKNELVATVPFGFVICLLCLAANSIWPAIVLHLLIAITAESMIIFSIKKTFKLYIA
ncbi:MAG: CPBP family intramembrane glutamic endopeptidase [Ferruginibacter sp.]